MVLASIEGAWKPAAIEAVRKHLEEVIAPTRIRPDGEDIDPFVVGHMDYLRQSQYQGGWIAKQRAVEDFLTRTKGPFRLSKVEGGMMRGWVLSNGSRDWLYVTPEMNGKNWEQCLMMSWDTFERCGVQVMYIGEEKPKPGTVPAFVRS